MEQLNHFFTPDCDFSDWTIMGRVSADFAQDVQIAGNNGSATGHGLHRRQSEALSLRRQQHQRGAAIQGGQDTSVYLGKNKNRSIQFQLPYELSLFRAKVSTRAQQAGLRKYVPNS